MNKNLYPSGFRMGEDLVVFTHPSPLYPTFPQNSRMGGRRFENRSQQGKPPADSCFRLYTDQIFAGRRNIDAVSNFIWFTEIIYSPST
jgi:hypothetical protein